MALNIISTAELLVKTDRNAVCLFLIICRSECVVCTIALCLHRWHSLNVLAHDSTVRDALVPAVQGTDLVLQMPVCWTRGGFSREPGQNVIINWFPPRLEQLVFANALL